MAEAGEMGKRGVEEERRTGVDEMSPEVGQTNVFWEVGFPPYRTRA